MNSGARPIAAFFMIAFLTACALTAGATIILRNEKLVPDAPGAAAYFNGKKAKSFENKFEENLLIRDAAVGIWGAVQYGVFKSGGKKAVVGEEGWLYTAEEFESLPGADKAEERFLNLARAINENLKSHGVRLVVALVPAKARIYPEHLGRHRLPESRAAVYARVLKSLRDSGVTAPDLAALFAAHKDGPPLYLRLDTHWTPQGAALAASEIAGAARGVKLEKTPYKFETIENQTVEGDLEKYIKTGVFAPLLAPAPESVARVKEESPSENGGLFGAENISVALVGTSYSAIDKWNFEGALKYALQADVLNLADEGQGPLEPMAKFLKETDFKTSNLKLVVWEVPERFIPVSYPDVKFPPFIEGNP